LNYERRMGMLRESLREQELEAIFVTNLTNVRYLCGFAGSNGMLLITERAARFFTDGRYRTQSAKQVQGADIVVYDNPPDLGPALQKAASDLGAKEIGLEAANVTIAKREELEESFAGSGLVATKRVVEGLRAVKDEEEIDLMRTAAQMADDGFSHILDYVNAGMTEKEVALELEFYMRRGGADGVSFSPIVAAGQRSALPHANPTERVIEEGDFLLFDLGCIYKGYCSDLTRTVTIGPPDDRQRSVYEVILASNEAGLSAAGPTKAASEVDRASRDVVAEAGYPEAFSHGLGHGVGMEVHESPTVRSTSEDILVAGNVVTIEPGAYFPDWGGVRIEDLVVITDSGKEVLSKSSKEMIVL
jgi:Xaa-Pro aminopeptidase